ncbi:MULTISPECIES: S8 family serine peptidase [Halorussus]|uniref:S8 family serine peptidase n=1 Tax=Halorussus TaxID=1070314 RepID=UPI00209F7404|nr:S8 family serine peptidase [Halorussus vallis]USZ74658.1 S8 family serine peptidase [Halorussus vallis]
MPNLPNFDRRSFLKTTGAAGVAATLPFAGASAAEAADGDGSIVDDALVLTSGVLHDVLVVFDPAADVNRLDTLDLAEGFYEFETLPVAYVKLYSDQVRQVADWDGVRYVQKNVELDYHNDDARAVTEVDKVQNDLGYAGDGVHVAVIDSGVDGDHPDLQSSLVANWQWAGNPLGSPTLWIRAGSADTDTIGHGTHVSGTIAGDGTQSGGQFKGMAPNADLTVYAAGAGISILKATAAYDHLLSRVQSGATDVKLVNNSYGSSNGNDFNPDDALNVATWNAYRAGLLSMFSAGNSGPQTNTLNQYAKAPQVLGVAATKDNRAVTNFSSRGRKQGGDAQLDNWDRQTGLSNLETYYADGTPSRPYGVYRPGVGAPGNRIVSTMSPTDALQAESAQDGRLYYATISGTSMSSPVTTGIATLVVDAYRQNNSGDVAPMDLLNTVAAEAEDARSGYTPWNVGAGFTNAYRSVQRAANGNLATFGDVTLVEY